MKRILLISSLFLSQITFGQKNLVTINGKVSDQDNFNKQIFALKARLSFNDSLFIETFCDSSGHYQFQISQPLLNNNKPRVYVFQDLKLLDKLFPPPADCPFLFNGPDQYWSHNPTTIEFKNNISNYQVNFELHRAIIDKRLPCLNFRKNSTEFIKCSDDPSGDTVVFCIKNFMLQNPTIVLEIIAHSWDESSKVDLSIGRANLIRQKLVALGIDKERIKSVGYGDTRPLIDSKTIKRAKTIEEKEVLKSQNRRADFKILSFDYDPKLKKIRSADNKTPTDKDDE